MPARVVTYATGLANRVNAPLPEWFDAFVEHLAERYSPAETRLRLRTLGLLLSNPHNPTELVNAAHHADGRISPLSRALEDFFAANHIVDAVGDTQRRAARRRQRAINQVPAPLRPHVTAFSDAELNNRERAQRTGAKPRSDQTLLIHLEVIADFTRKTPTINDWATVTETDIETYVATRNPTNTYTLGSLRNFFAWARATRRILINPTRHIHTANHRYFTGPIVDLARQRELFNRWTTNPTVTPNEAAIGLLCLIHACSVNELRHLNLTDVKPADHTLQINGRSQPVPLDPATWTAIEATINNRPNLHTKNPHLFVNRRTKTTTEPISQAHAHDLLKPLDTTPQRLRCTRLAQLVTTIDPILTTEIFGLTHKAILYYLGDTQPLNQPMA